MRRVVTSTMVAALSLALTACSTDDTSGEAAETPTPAPAVETPTPEPEVDETAEPTPADDDEAELSPDDKVIADYLAARDAFLAAYDPPDPEHPELLAAYDGEALEGAQDQLRDLRAEGHSFIGSFDSHPKVVVLEPDAAIVRDCYHEQSQRIDTETREEVDEPFDEIRHVDTTLELRDATWVIVHRVSREETCTPGE